MGSHRHGAERQGLEATDLRAMVEVDLLDQDNVLKVLLQISESLPLHDPINVSITDQYPLLAGAADDKGNPLTQDDADFVSWQLFRGH